MHEPPVIWPYPVFGDPNGTIFDMNPKLLLDCGPTPLHDDTVREHTVTLRAFEKRLGGAGEKVDLDDGNLSPVRNVDGRRSSTCAAVVDALEWHLRRARRLSREDDLSPDVLSSLCKHPVLRNEATSLFHVLLRLKAHGMPRARAFGKDGRFEGDARRFFEEGHRLSIADYVLLDYLDSRSSHPNPEAWRAWMTHVGPVVVRVMPDDVFASPEPGPLLDKYRGPKFRAGGGHEAEPTRHAGTHHHGSTDQDGPAIGQHAAVLTGYRHVKGGFVYRLRNSWGEKWASGGYVDVSEAWAVQAFTEAWGIHLGRETSI